MDNLAADFEINPNNPLNAEYELGEGVGFDCSFELFASGTVWGNIDGDINNQTDLINLFNTKVDLTDFEELSQTVTNNYNELSGDIANLTITVTDNYNTLSGQISDLTSTVNNNYTSLDNRLTTAEGSILDLTDTVNDNYTELDGKITTTNNNLSTLSQTVEDNNTAVNNRIDETNDIVSDLSDTVTSNYNTLDDKIDTEISNRTSADTTLQNNIDTEASTRQNADTVLQNNINILSQTVTDNNTAINNKVDGINTALTNSINSLSNTVSNNYTTLDTKIDNTKTSLEGDISDLSDTVNQNYTDLSNAITTSASTINSRIDGEVSTLNTAIGTETTNRQNADNNLQSQIDAIVSSSDVFDIVGTYAELQAYDITIVPVNDIIKVLIDNTHDGSATYYRCIENEGVKSWLYIGSEGAYYTKSESDTRFVNKNTTINNIPLSSNITLTASDVNALPDTTVIGDGVLTLQKNGVNIDTFNANATANKSINITVPTDTADLTNGAGFITSASLPTVNNGTLDIQVNGTSIGTFTANQSENTTANIVVPDTATWGNITGTLSDQTDLQTALNGKQATLVSGTNIKTINSTSLLGSGNIAVQPTLVSGTNIKTINSTSLLGSGNISVQPTITSSAKLSSDLVDDTNHTHKFATAAQLSQIATNTSNISTINGKIPSQASSSNQLADKAFVNSSIKSDLNSLSPLRYSRYSIAQVNSTNKFIKLASMTYTQSGNRDFSYLFWVEILEASHAKCYAFVRLSARWSDTNYQGHKFEILEKYGDPAASLEALKNLTYAYSLNTTTHKITAEIWLEIKNQSYVSYYLRPTECNEYGDYSSTPVTLNNNIWTYYNQSGNASSIASTAITSGLTQVKVTDATGVRNENDLSHVIKTWIGTKAQYDAIVSKDSNTLYYLTDTGQIYKGTTLISDKTTLYSTTGQNTNGAMTQKAVSDITENTRFDGQWVYLTSNMLITNNTTLVKNNTYTYDISSFLPNDEYNYELILSAAGYTGTASGNTANIYARSDLNKNAAEGTLIARGMTRTSNTASWGGSINLIVGKQRQVHIINTGSADATNVFVILNAYRRIGTNI